MNLQDFYNEKELGIWRWKKFFLKIPNIKLSLDEGNTRLEKYNFLGRDFFVKREDQNPAGSHKIRGIAYQISTEIQNLQEKNQNLDFTISTSGNAGVAISEILRKFNDEILEKKSFLLKNPIKFFVFVPKFIEERKLTEMGKNPNCIIKISDEPKKESLILEKEGRAKSLRQSTSEFATEGFKTLAFEIFEDFPNVENIFFPVSSGTSMLGTFYGFLDLRKLGIVQKIPNFFAVQTTKVFPIVKEFLEIQNLQEKNQNNIKIKNFLSEIFPEENHPASAISDYICYRKKEIFDEIRNLENKNQNGFFAMAISTFETIEARKILEEKFGLFVSYESALTFSAWQKSEMPKNSVLISSGAKNL